MKFIPILVFQLLVLGCRASCPDSCSLLGSCRADGTCDCDPGFTGANCGVLDLAPATRHGSGFHNDTLSSWGGKVIKIGDTFHMFASAMSGNCSLMDFSTNSMSVRATSKTPEGPFSFAEAILPPFHHSTTVVHAGASMASDNGLLMFTIGKDTHSANLHHCNGSEPQPLPRNCSLDMSLLGCERGGRSKCIACITMNRHRIPPDSCWKSNCPSHKCFSAFRKTWCMPRPTEGLNLESSNKVDIGPHDYMSITTAPSVTGPWTERTIFRTDPSEPHAWNCNKSNPSPVVLPNGTILLMYRGQRCKRDPSCRTATSNLCERVGIAVANDASSPFRDRQGDIVELAGNEDAFFWKGKRGFHAIFHSKNACGQDDLNVNSCGSLAWSTDSWKWHLNKAPTYNKTIVWAAEADDAGSVGHTFTDTLLARQRPKILFDEDGSTPLYLYNGVQTEGNFPGGRQWTLAVPFQHGKARPALLLPRLQVFV